MYIVGSAELYLQKHSTYAKINIKNISNYLQKSVDIICEYVIMNYRNKSTKQTEEIKMLTIKMWNEKDMQENERNLKEYGYTKTSDCMWAKIYTKGNNEVTLIREY